MEIKGLMDKTGYGFPKSRDYSLPNFPCKQYMCICNEGGKCISPACCSIGEDGKCIGFNTKIK